MFIKEKYQRRHKLLGILYDEFFENDDPNAFELDRSLTFSQLEKKSNLTTQQLIKEIDYLIETKEIVLQETEDRYYYWITLKGRSSYHDEKYLYSGKKEFWNDTYDIIKTLSAIILLVLAVLTFIQNSVNINRNTKEIEQLKKEINQINALGNNNKQ